MPGLRRVLPDPGGAGMSEHWYYLHTNGELIHKRTWPGEDNSDFVKRIWACDPTNRENAWTILVEALASGANVQRVRELAATWKCDGRDLPNYMRAISAPSKELRDGMRLFIEHVLRVGPDDYYDWLAKTPNGHEPDWATMPVAGVDGPSAADCNDILGKPGHYSEATP